MSYSSYTKNSTFPPLAAPSAGSPPVDAVVVTTLLLNTGGPITTTLGDMVTDPGNSIELFWQLNDSGGFGTPSIIWYAEAAGYTGTDFATAMCLGGTGVDIPFTLRGYNLDGMYRDYTIAVTVVNNP